MSGAKFLLVAIAVVLGLAAYFGPAYRRMAPGALGKFYDSVDYTPAAVTLTSYADRAETVCGYGCPPDRHRQIEQQYTFPLFRKLHLKIPPALVHRLGAYEHGLAGLETTLWASDGLFMRELPEGIDASKSTRDDIIGAVNRRTIERVARGDRIVIISMMSAHKPPDIVLLEFFCADRSCPQGRWLRHRPR